MDTVVSIFKSITSLSSFVMLPLAILILSLISGMKLGKAFRSSVFIGIGLLGLSTMVNLFASTLGPVLLASWEIPVLTSISAIWACSLC